MRAGQPHSLSPVVSAVEAVRIAALAAAFAAAAGAAAAAAAAAETLYDLAVPGASFVAVDAEASHDAQRGGLRVRFGAAEWPQVRFDAPGGAWDWRAHAGIAVELFNPEDEPVAVSMRVDNAGADGMAHCNTVHGWAAPRSAYTLRCRFKTSDEEALWGMRGVPPWGPPPLGGPIDPGAIVSFQVFLARPARPHTLVLERTVLLDGPAAAPLPFVDRFGQYAHAAWPGKIARDDELPARLAAERAVLESQPPDPARDAFGGWAAGPRLEATGRFRTAQHEGRWWLVTPEGALFWSIGIDCVGYWEQTFVDGRDGWFEWLPAREDPVFGGMYGHAGPVHSMAEIIGGAGRTFSFYRANLARKYGPGWPEAWRAHTAARLRAWGFNTLGNWSQGDVLEHAGLPYVVSGAVSGVRPIEGATGYWAKMMDAYAPEFAAQADALARGLGAAHGARAHCIGYFVDNELAWEGVAAGALASPPDQPARRAFIELLRARYGRIEALEAAWQTTAADWDALRAPPAPNAAAQTDLDAYLHGFARAYFDTLRGALARHAPGQLYLGCRFSTAPEPAVRACAAIAGVVSFNRYERAIACAEYLGLEKPILIGEFHFGAIDRGLFHPGLVETPDQAARAAAYAAYVRAAAACPAVVGAHWFQWADEPITGRVWDGENYNIGFVDATDTAYPELSAAARAVHAEVYPLHAAAAPE